MARDVILSDAQDALPSQMMFPDNSSSSPATTDIPALVFSTTVSSPNIWMSSLRQLYEKMAGMLSSNDTCDSNCSGRGECLNGSCICQVQYEGTECTDPNIAYFAGFATVFYMVAAVSLVQLFLCVRFEYLRLKTPRVGDACQITTQKLLYLAIFLAAVLRGAYFSSPNNADLILSSSFMSAFYPVILTAGSLVVCFWAEAFHLQNIHCGKPRFLSKSFCGFLVFNIITYSLFLTEVLLMRQSKSYEERSSLAHIFSGCYAVLLFIVVVFFLIYGVEVYFKVRGGFLCDTVIVGNIQSKVPVAPPTGPESTLSEGRDHLLPSACQGPELSSQGAGGPAECVEATEALLGEQLQGESLRPLSAHQPVDHSQLHQSRFGLVFQACMLMITVCFLCSDVVEEFWKCKVQLKSRNAYDVVFRIVELAVALWFPCVLWNCVSPEQLWILNPQKILKKFDIDKTLRLGGQPVPAATAEGSTEEDNLECWICYDKERVDAGPLIRPCDCRGDMGAVHHNCLRKWLMECAENNSTENLACKVCRSPYKLERGKAWWIGQGFTLRHWFQTAVLVTIMCGASAGAWALLSMLSQGGLTSALVAGATMLVIYVCLKFLGFNTFKAYQRARYSAVKILSRHFPGIDPPRSHSAPVSAVPFAVPATQIQEGSGLPRSPVDDRILIATSRSPADVHSTVFAAEAPSPSVPEIRF